MNTEEKLTAQESLDIISSMIRQAKGNATSNSFYFLLWGWTLVVANLGVYLLVRFTNVTDPAIAFSITIVSAVISMVHGARQDKKKQSRSILDSINIWLWVGFGVTCFTIAFFGERTNWQINPVVVTMASVPTFITGIMLRFRPLMIGGVVLWLSGIVLFLLPMQLQFLFTAFAITGGYIIPGYMLKHSQN